MPKSRVALCICLSALTAALQEPGDGHCHDRDAPQTGERSLLQTSGNLRRAVAQPLALAADSEPCPAECKSPKCIPGALWNGGEALNTFSQSCESYCSAVAKVNGFRGCGYGPQYWGADSVNCAACSQKASSAMIRPSFSLHDIVGDDGVLVLSRNKSQDRFDTLAHSFARVNVNVTHFLASTENTSAQELESGCKAQTGDHGAACASFNKTGEGCAQRGEQAIALSHKRALELALKREQEWTAVFEDDAIPFNMYNGTWGEGLRNVWSKLPQEARFVRLGWCGFNVEQVITTPRTEHLEKEPFLANHHPIGGCTHAYLVHKYIIPELLGLFPCCCGVDCCWELDYFDKPNPNTLGKFRSQSVIVDMDIDGSEAWSQERVGTSGWFGLVTQNRVRFATERVALLESDNVSSNVPDSAVLTVKTYIRTQ